jgi:hypothetical protein
VVIQKNEGEVREACWGVRGGSVIRSLNGAIKVTGL